jgi:hypothetical protein
MRLVGRELKMGEKTSAWKFLARKPEIKRPLKNLGVDRSIILK